jgi:LysM repeat protein
MKPTRYHSVRKGETLSTIGKRYGITAQSLKSWNKLSGTTIHTGQKLIVQRTKVPTNAPVVAEQAQASRNVAPAKAIAGTNSPALATKKTGVADSTATPTSASAQGTATSAGASSQSNVSNNVASRSSVSHNNANPSNATHNNASHNNASHSTVSKSNTPHNNATHSTTSLSNAAHSTASNNNASHNNASHITVSHSNTAHITVSPGTAPTGALGATASAQHTASTKSNSQPEQPQAQEGTTEQASARTAQAEAESPVQKVINYIYYTVRKGDTLWDIAQRKGISVAELLKVNKLTPSSRLQPGQKLKIAAG